MAEPWQQQFQAFVGKSDEEITSLVQGFGGYPTLLSAVFNGMAGSIDPARAPGTTLSYRLTDGGAEHVYNVVIDQPAARVVTGEPESARLTYRLSAPDMVRMLAGELDGAAAFQSGRIQLDGDLAFAGQVSQIMGSRS